jgi:large subunit ribosomal protein L29
MRDLKAEKIREMTEDEILTKIRELKEELFHLRFRNQMRQLQNPLLLREKKRDVARMNTVLAEHRSGLRPLAGHAAAPAAGAAEAKTAAPAAKPAARAKAAKSKPKKAAKSKSRPTASKAKAKAKAKPAAKRKAKKS